MLTPNLHFIPTTCTRGGKLRILLISVFAFLPLGSTFSYGWSIPVDGLVARPGKLRSSRKSTISCLKLKKPQIPFPAPSLNGPAIPKVALQVSVLSSNQGSDQSEEERLPKTMNEAVKTFLLGKYSGPRAILMILASLTLWRATLPMSILMDGVLFVVMIVLWWFQEHAFHILLHSDHDWYGKTIHSRHHELPYYHISIDPAPLMLAWLFTAHVVLRCLLPLPFALSATLGYACAGFFYEWAHYIVHTKVHLPRHSYWRKLRDHHIKHHLVNSSYWLGFSVLAVDNFWGTNGKSSIT